MIIIDGINRLPEEVISALLGKAELWADANIVKMVFVNSDEEIEMFVQKQSGSWSRVSTPLVFGCLSREEAMSFLLNPHFMENEEADQNCSIEKNEAERIVDLVGGHISHLITFKKQLLNGESFEDTANDLKKREMEKFLHVSSSKSNWEVVAYLRDTHGKRMLLSKLIKMTSFESVRNLAKYDIILFRREKSGIVVTFQTPLMETVVDEMETAYQELKREIAQETFGKKRWTFRERSWGHEMEAKLCERKIELEREGKYILSLGMQKVEFVSVNQIKQASTSTR